MPKEAVEGFTTNPIIEIQKLSTKVLHANNIMTFDKAEEEQKTLKILQHMTKMQNETLKQRNSFALKACL